MPSVVRHTNRKGQTFYLHQRHRSSERTAYVFMKEPSEGALSEIPEGYEIVEGVHGTVSLRKKRPHHISQAELRTVCRVLESHPHLSVCRAAVKGKTIEVYEPRSISLLDRGVDPHRLGLDWPGAWSSEQARQYSERHANYGPQMRFVLVDRKGRHFRVERMCHRSWHDGWLSLERTGPLPALAEQYLPHLRRESFFELWPY